MKSDRPFRVGVYLDISRQYGREIAQGIADYAVKHAHWRLVGGGDVMSIADRIRGGRLDGIIARIPDPQLLNTFEHFGIPVVDTYGQTEASKISTVACDSRKVAHLAMEWFLRRRFTSFAFVGFADTPFSEQRREEMRRMAVLGGYPFASFDMASEACEKLIRTTLAAEQLGAAPDESKLIAFLRHLPERTAVFCANDARAYHVIHAAEAGGIAIPDQLAVMGTDNDPVLCSLATPNLTSVDPNARQVGFDAARLLEAMMRDRARGTKVPQVRHRLVDPLGVVERGTTDFDPVDQPWLREAIRYIREHLDDGINVADVYSHAGVSHTKFERAFRAEMGVSPHEFLISLRLDDAKQMLRNTKLPVCEIATRTGFSSAQYFNRLFSATLGTSPGEWRRLNREK